MVIVLIFIIFIAIQAGIGLLIWFLVRNSRRKRVNSSAITEDITVKTVEEKKEKAAPPEEHKSTVHFGNEFTNSLSGAHLGSMFEEDKTEPTLDMFAKSGGTSMGAVRFGNAFSNPVEVKVAEPVDENHLIDSFLKSEMDDGKWKCPACETENYMVHNVCCVCYYKC